MSEKIHILHVSKSSGGVGTYTRRLVNALDRNRYKFTVVCLAEGCEKMADDLSRLEGVDAIAIPMSDGIEPFSDVSICFKLAKIIRENKFDLIHAHTSKPGFFARLANIGTSIPVIYRPASFAFHENAPRLQANVYAVLERFAARYLTEKIVAVCNGERELARQYSVGTDDQFVVIHTGIDIQPFDLPVDRDELRKGFGIPSNVYVLGTVARLSEQKAPEDFVKAAAIAHANLPDLHFLWVGDGPLEDSARSLVSSLGLAEVFHFAGHQTEIPKMLKLMDCFVLSSHWEGFSIAVLESMAAGLPVISTLVTGAAEAVIDGETGLLVEIGDVDGLAQAMEKMIKTPGLLKSMSIAARKRAENVFPYSKMLLKIEDLYSKVLSLEN